VIRKRRALAIVLGLSALAYGASGLVVVPQGEAVVVRRLGRVLPKPWYPGLHLGWPWGFDRLDRVRTDEVRRLTIGLSGTPGVWDEPGAGEYLSGDLNVLRAEATVQYRVSDPLAFTVRSAEVEPLLRRLAESAMSRALARQGIDATFREGRAEAAREAAGAIARGIERYGLGVSVLGVSLTDARPPTEVAADFASAQSARSDRDRRVNEAKAYATNTATAANARARARLEQARAKADRTLALARGRASRFVSLLAGAENSRALTVRRLYLDTIRELLPRVGRKLVLAPDEPVDLSLIGAGR
jgi:membrane protease subunit HflK